MSPIKTMLKISITPNFQLFVTCFQLLLNIQAEEIPWTQSPYHLSYLVTVEQQIYQKITTNNSSFLATLDPKSETRLRDWIQDYEECSNHSNNGWELNESNSFLNFQSNNNAKVFGNPILILRMFERFLVLLEEIVPFLPENYPLGKLIHEEQQKFGLPDLSHKLDVLDSIIRLTEIYQLDIKDEFVGIPQGLKPRQIYEIGKRAMYNKMYTEAMNWMSLAYTIASTDEDGTYGLNSTVILELMTTIALMHDDDFNNPDHPIKYKYTRLFIDDSKMERQKDRQIQNVLKYPQTPIKLSKDELDTRFELICNGHNFQSDIEKARLYCWYESRINLAWIIGPLKMELLDPVISLVHVHDFIGNKTIESILEIALPRIKKSVYSFVRTDRVSSGTFLEDENYPILEKLSRSYEKLTGLRVVNTLNEFRKGYLPPWNRNYASTPYQINAYSFGGYFGAHIDTTRMKGVKLDPETERFAGERMMTLIAYLNDVDRGGFTAFSDIGVAAVPKKGSVLMWYTLRKNGKVYCRSVHGGCPVLSGTKIIANKWIHEHENYQKRKCSLNELV